MPIPTLTPGKFSSMVQAMWAVPGTMACSTSMRKGVRGQNDLQGKAKLSCELWEVRGGTGAAARGFSPLRGEAVQPPACSPPVSLHKTHLMV